jgi:Holliday junction resolvase
MNGSHYERELAKHLDSEGYKVVRSPASGSATKRDLPDLFWSKPTETAIAVELKATSQNVAYYEKEEVSALMEFAMAFNAIPLLGARFKQDTSYYLWHPTDVRRTESERYAADRDIQAHETIDP